MGYVASSCSCYLLQLVPVLPCVASTEARATLPCLGFAKLKFKANQTMQPEFEKVVDGVQSDVTGQLLSSIT